MTAAPPSYIALVPLRRKALVWLLLACTSVWFAEVTATSSRFPFVTPQGWLLLVPWYGLHVLLGGWLVMRANRLTWPIVYLPGMLLGLYEAYFTKVLWDPTWTPEWSWRLGGVSVAHTLILVWFWHPLFAFVVPLALVERAVTGSHEVLDALPRPLRWLLSTRAGLVVAGSVTGFDSALNAGPLVAVGSAATTVLLVLALRELVVRAGPLPSLRAVLPTNRQAAVLAVLLLAGYVAGGILVRRPSLPPVWPAQATIWGMYAVVVALLWLAHRRARDLPVVLAPPYDPPVRRPVVTLAITFTAAALVSTLVPLVTPWVGMTLLVGGTATCLIWFVQVSARLLSGRGG